MLGKIFSIEEFATFDGPGIRTTVFLKGCPLRCEWCHNPEGQSPNGEYVKSFNGCVNCGKCLSVAKTVNGKKMFTEDSVKACNKGLIKLCGEDFTAKELTDKLLKNTKILNANNGGITFSGGEPLYQADFILECIKEIDGRLNVAIQTSGFVKEEVFAKVLNKADYFLFDLKLMDGTLHKRYCGKDNGVILSNYNKLVKSGKPFITRVPLIPEVTDTLQNITAIAEFMKGLGINKVEVMPYNKMAGAKYPSLLLEYKPTFNEQKEVNENVEKIFATFGIDCKKM